MQGGRIRRDWLTDAGLALLATVLGVFFAIGSVSDGEGAPLAVNVATGLISAVLLVLLRRNRPVLLTVLLIPLGILFALPMGAVPVALFAVALHRPARYAIGLAALHAAAVIVIYRVAVDSTRTYLEAVTFLVLLHVSVVAVGLLVRSHRLLVRSLAERARQAEAGQRMRVDQARLAERERIAREMHDVLAHRISLLAVHAGALEVRRGAPPAERTAAGVVRQSAHDALEELRQVITMLRDDDTADRPQPTLGDVPALVDESRAAGATVELDLDGGADVPERVGRNAYRIVQEALTNARKHAPGAAVRVAVRGRADEGVVVEVGNRLVPSGSLPGAGAGLTGLRERVDLAGGRFEHGPTAGGEFRLRAWLPWTP